MRLLIAAPIIAERTGQALKKAQEAMQRGANLVEYRIDRMKAVTLETIIIPEIPCIITNRHPEEDKNSPGYYCEPARLSKLKEAARIIAKNESIKEGYIDIESNFLKEDFLKYMNRDKIKIIVSYHDFDKTPSLEELEKTCDQIANQGADILKIATMINDEEDIRKITDLRKYIKIPAIIIGMGEKGKLTRVAPENYLTFGALSKDECSAPGQYTIEEIIEHFEKNNQEQLNDKKV